MADVVEVVVGPALVVEVVDSGGNVETVSAGPVLVLEIVERGLQGVPGAGGSAVDFTQASPLSVWTIAHNLGREPIISVTSVGGVVIGTPEALHLSTDVVQLTFDAPFAGRARLI